MKRELFLGVNIDHVATIREARGVDYPSPVEAAKRVMAAGADGVTIHLREDRRHIQDADVFAIRELGVPLNLEMAAVDSIAEIAEAAKPDEVCLVPERRQEVTTEGGLDAVGGYEQVAAVTGRLMAAGIGVSLFIEAEEGQIRAAKRMGAAMIELHTGRYCNVSGEARRAEVGRLAAGAALGASLGLRVNAGHGLHYGNTAELIRAIPQIHTLNIGHAIVARAVFVGLEAAVGEMRRLMAEAVV